MNHTPLDLDGHLGAWHGTWSTWLEPGVLHDSSPVSAEVVREGDGWSIAYHGPIEGDDVTGSMLLKPTPNGLDIFWTDTWHTAGVEQHLHGTAEAPPSYAYGPADEPWRWSIDIRPAPDGLVISHTNAPPDGDPAEAVRMVLQR